MKAASSKRTTLMKARKTTGSKDPSKDRAPNVTLKAVREQMGLTQPEFAQKIRKAGDEAGESNACSKDVVSRWESGKARSCRPNYRRALQSVTGLPYDRLGFADSAPAPSLVPRPGTHATPAAAAVVLAHAVDQADYLCFALRPPRAATSQSAAAFEQATAQLYDQERNTPARSLFACADQHTQHGTSLLAGTQDQSLRRRLALSAGYSAALTGYLAFDQGDTRTAQDYWDSARAAACTTGESALMACILTYQAQQATQRGDPAAAWHLAMTASLQAGPDPAAQAWTGIQAAYHAAGAGQSEAALARATQALDLATRLPSVSANTAPWVRCVDACAVVTMAAAVNERLGDYTDARTTINQILHTLGPEATKTRALALARITHIAAHTGDLATAVRRGRDAVQLVTRLECTASRRLLHAAIPLLANRRHAGVRDLLGQIKQLPGYRPSSGGREPHDPPGAQATPVRSRSSRQPSRAH